MALDSTAGAVGALLLARSCLPQYASPITAAAATITQGSQRSRPGPAVVTRGMAAGAVSRSRPAAARLSTSGGMALGRLPPGVRRPTKAGSR